MDKATGWPQLTLEAGRHGPEQLEAALLAAGALAVTLQDAGDQPVLEPAPGATPLWPRVRVTGLFDALTDKAQVAARVRRLLGGAEALQGRWETLADREWTRAWLDDYRPMSFGRRLWVCPHGQTPSAADAVVVHLDPGLAFGTGTHPTTALCLTWLDGADLRGQDVIDYGCGSGILAIAAAQLGARRVYAVDIDPQALLASAANAAANGVAARVAVSTPDGLRNESADVVIANILANPLMALAPRLNKLLGAQGRLVLAGLLVHQAPAVQTAFAPWFRFTRPWQREEWVLLSGTRHL
jgi:ribosomal protein L11 methyltransferase